MIGEWRRTGRPTLSPGLRAVRPNGECVLAAVLFGRTPWISNPHRPTFPRPVSLTKSMKESPRRPQNKLGLFSGGSPSSSRAARRQQPHPPSPQCKRYNCRCAITGITCFVLRPCLSSKEEVQTEEELEEIKKRMGTLSLHGGQVHTLSLRWECSEVSNSFINVYMGKE